MAVRWFDGLLVGSGHFEHTDRRLDGRLSEVCGALVPQPGLVGDESGGRTPHQLVTIESQTREGDDFNISLNITRGFRALTPAGGLVVGVSNTQPRFGVPVTSVTAKLSVQGVVDGDYLVCVKQVARDDVKVEKKVGEETGAAGIELGYPGLWVDMVAVEEFKERVASDFGEHAVVGLISLVNGELVVDAGYVPPVLRCESVASFDDGLVPSLKTLLEDLFRLSVDLVRTSTAALSRGQVGADLVSRRSDYESLRTFLLGRTGVVRNIDRISPAQLHYEVLYPIAVWWRQYYDQQFKQATAGVEQSPVKRVFDLANALTDLSYADLCAGSGDILREAKKFIEGLNRELGTIG